MQLMLCGSWIVNHKTIHQLINNNSQFIQQQIQSKQSTRSTMSMNQPLVSSQPSPSPSSISCSSYLHLAESLLLRGYSSQLLFTGELPPSLKIPALISCKMYEQATIELINLKQEDIGPLELLWIVACSHMIGMNYDEYYEKLKQDTHREYRQLADDWIKMNKPLNHPPEIKSMFRKKFEELLLLAQQQSYFQTPKMPVFLLPCSWLQKFYNNSLTFVPAINPTELYQPMPYLQTDPSCFHYNYALKESMRENTDYKIVPFQAWQYLYGNFGGLEFRRFTTQQKQPICELSFTKLKIIIAQGRYLYNLQEIQLLAGRFDTVISIIERVKKIMVGYRMIEFESLRMHWEPILISHLQVNDFIDIVQDQDRDLMKEATENGYQLYRLEYDHDIEDSQYTSTTDILLLTLSKSSTTSITKLDYHQFIDVHAIPYKKTTKKYNKCLSCQTTQQLQQCQCKQVYFCSKECRAKNKDHLKICQSLQKQDSRIAHLIDMYDVNRRKYKFGDLLRGGKIGLENLGNTCYMNAALQCVLTIRDFNQYFVANQHVKELNVSNVLGSGGNLVCAYGQLVKDYYTTNRRALEPIKVLKIISSKNAQFRGYNHQDSQQFFSYFFDKLHEDLNRVRDKPYIENIQSDGRPDEIVSDLSWRNYLKRNNSFVSQNFAGQYRSQIRCPDCERISITFDPFLSVTLPFPKQETQQQLVGYVLTRDGQYKKVEKNISATMSSQYFISNFFTEPVYPLWLRKKQPSAQWKPKKSVQYNNDNRGALIFYMKPKNSTVELQVKFDGYDIFHRKIFTEPIPSQEALLTLVYISMKSPLLRATKDEQIIKISDQQYIKRCQQSKFLQIKSNSIKSYPFSSGIATVTLKISEPALPFALKDKIKFDFSFRGYQHNPSFKFSRVFTNGISIPELLQSFSQPEQLTEQNSWYCSKCKDHKLAQKIMSIYKTGEYLVLHLKRFNHRGNRYVIYGEKVRMPIKLQDVQTINGIKYGLFGVVNHFGNLSMGHYTAFVKREQDWYYADDSSFKRREVDGSEAYLLFYRRVK